MSDDLSRIPVLVPEGKDVTDLTLGELDMASYQLRADVLECISGDGSPKRYGAFCQIAVLWAKRSGDPAKREDLLERFRNYTSEEIFRALRMDTTGEPNAEVDPPSTDSAPSESPSPTPSDG